MDGYNLFVYFDTLFLQNTFKVLSFVNRYVKTPYYEEDLNVMSSFGNLAASPANTHIVNHAGKLLALEETSLPKVLN